MSQPVRRDVLWASPISLLLALVLLALVGGCGAGPRLLKSPQPIIDRKIVEYPAGTELRLYIDGLTAPTAIAWDHEGSLLIAEGGLGGHDVRIIGYKKDGSFFQVYPRGTRLPFRIGSYVGLEKFRVRGPGGGMGAATGGAARHMLVKGGVDRVARGGEVLHEIDGPVVEALEAMGGTGDTLTGLACALLDSGRDVPEACLLAARANRLAGMLARPTPASHIGEIVARIPEALAQVLASA
jgi:hypothetical protein